MTIHSSIFIDIVKICLFISMFKAPAASHLALIWLLYMQHLNSSIKTIFIRFTVPDDNPVYCWLLFLHAHPVRFEPRELSPWWSDRRRRRPWTARTASSSRHCIGGCRFSVTTPPCWRALGAAAATPAHGKSRGWIDFNQKLEPSEVVRREGEEGLLWGRQGTHSLSNGSIVNSEAEKKQQVSPKKTLSWSSVCRYDTLEETVSHLHHQEQYTFMNVKTVCTARPLLCFIKHTYHIFWKSILRERI